MLRGELYIADDPELDADQARAQVLLERYNATRHEEQDIRDRLLWELLGDVGEGVVVKPPFRCDYGARIAIAADTFVNYDCVMLDVAPITIGAACQLATRVQFLTATHPIDPEPRRLGWESAEPITRRRQRLAGRRRDRLPGRDDRRRHRRRRRRGRHARPAGGRRRRRRARAGPARDRRARPGGDPGPLRRYAAVGRSQPPVARGTRARTSRSTARATRSLGQVTTSASEP